MSLARASTTSTGSHPTAVGDLLRQWREARRLSQLDLSLDTGVSTRHLSYVETGKARPSRELIDQLAEALSVPLRERNALLVAAGFAPRYRESDLSAPELEKLRRAIEYIIAQQEPYPAFVTNRYWDVLAVNEGMRRLFGLVKGEQPKHGNILRQVFDPEDMRPYIENWAEVAGDLVRHLHQQIAASPGDAKLRGLLDEVLAYPNLPPNWRHRELGSIPLPVVPTVFRSGRRRLCFFSTLTTFSSPLDVTLEEVRIECMFPTDDATAELCRSLA